MKRNAMLARRGATAQAPIEEKIEAPKQEVVKPVKSALVELEQPKVEEKAVVTEKVEEVKTAIAETTDTVQVPMISNGNKKKKTV